MGLEKRSVLSEAGLDAGWEAVSEASVRNDHEGGSRSGVQLSGGSISERSRAASRDERTPFQDVTVGSAVVVVSGNRIGRLLDRAYCLTCTLKTRPYVGEIHYCVCLGKIIGRGRAAGRERGLRAASGSALPGALTTPNKAATRAIAIGVCEDRRSAR